MSAQHPVGEPHEPRQEPWRDPDWPPVTAEQEDGRGVPASPVVSQQDNGQGQETSTPVCIGSFGRGTQSRDQLEGSAAHSGESIGVGKGGARKDVTETTRRILDAAKAEIEGEPNPTDSVIEFTDKILTALERRGKQIPMVYPSAEGSLSVEWTSRSKCILSRFDDGIVSGEYYDADTRTKHIFIIDAFDAEEYLAQLCTIAGFAKAAQ